MLAGLFFLKSYGHSSQVCLGHLGRTVTFLVPGMPYWMCLLILHSFSSTIRPHRSWENNVAISPSPTGTLTASFHNKLTFTSMNPSLPMVPSIASSPPDGLCLEVWSTMVPEYGKVGGEKWGSLEIFGDGTGKHRDPICTFTEWPCEHETGETTQQQLGMNLNA